MANDEENGYKSDDDINTKHHSRFLDDVFQLDKKQYVKKPTRTEASNHVSEFNLIKSSSGKRSTVNIEELTRVLENKSEHNAASKKIKIVQTKSRILRKPLEKPQVEKIKRGIGFKNVKLDLDKWDAIVIKNRVSTQLSFPLDEGDIEIYKGKKPNFQLTIKSELDKELEKLEPVVQTIEVEEKFPLSMKEILERRREMARLRAHQSYQEAKAHRQNKIKSKKFHRIQRKERVKNQIKEFELLQKTDPEEALRKLEELEKNRAEERMTLRHRSTGQWAKNKQIRAKYDKESRQVLAHQLSISRDLTQKLKLDDSSDSDPENITPQNISDPTNPWVNKTKSEVDDFVSGYRKFWDEKNKLENNKTEPPTKETNIIENEVEKINLDEPAIEVKKKVRKPKNSVIKCTTAWAVTPLQDDENIEDIFEDLQQLTQHKFSNKVNNLKKRLTNPVTTQIKKSLEQNVNQSKSKQKSKVSLKKNKTTNSDYLKLPKEKLRPEIDEEIGVNEGNTNEINKLKSMATIPTQTNDKSIDSSNIDPNKFLTVKPTNLHTLVPNNVILDECNSDLESDDAQKAFITEAFVDDDVVADFTKEKKDIVDKNRPQDVNLTLPGWGTWGGKNIKPSKRKKRRFVVKFPKKVPRRDDNKGTLIINEKKDDKIKQHQVSEVPFPFKSVQDFEASVRAPIGDTFVPQTAFRRLIKPSVITKKGEVIKPMDEQVLVKNKFTKRGMVVKV